MFSVQKEATPINWGSQAPVGFRVRRQYINWEQEVDWLQVQPTAYEAIGLASLCYYQHSLSNSSVTSLRESEPDSQLDEGAPRLPGCLGAS